MKLNAIQSLYSKDCHQDVDGNVFIEGKEPTKAQAEAIDKEVIRLTLEVHRLGAVQVVSRKYQALLDTGITYNGSTFQSDASSITALNEVLTAIANGWGIPANFAWIDSADVPHVADLTFLKGLAITLADHKAALFARLQVAKAALRSATTQAEIEAIAL